MVEQGFQYARFRDDKEAQKGYTAELVNNNVDKQFWENLDQPTKLGEERTLLDLFEKHCTQNPDSDFVGTRPIDAEGKAGDFTWQSFATIRDKVHKIGRGMCELDLAPEVEGDQKLK